MDHCNLSARAPWIGLLYTRRNDDAPLAGFPDPEHPYAQVVCELAKGHGEAHADFLEEMDADYQVWVRWEGEHFTYVCVRPCEMVDPTVDPVKQSACMLYVEHPSHHSWQLTDLPHD
ncbi:hypothetical protein [Streptomyces kronopolitis]|uniref:hypothetical protein n=1 Tax=Streptomyces kronopolitis TaxID=1612435 RepID=UPI003D95E9D2